MKIEFARRALREILREAHWWVENRPDAPLLFEEELKEALEKIRKAPDAPKVYRVVFENPAHEIAPSLGR